MDDFSGKLAVITGGGSGMGRELALALAKLGCHVALCDALPDGLAQTKAECDRVAPPRTRVSAHRCDVSEEAQVLAFRDEVLRVHGQQHVDLLFNNAGIGGAGSFIKHDRADWERTFSVCWFGVYFCTRAFLPLLIASTEACIVNTSSVNGFWACMGPMQPHSAYSSAKFAVKGFTEALLVELRVHAPHVKAFLVMPGHVGTSILQNSRALLGKPQPAEMTHEQLDEFREVLARRGTKLEGIGDAQLRTYFEGMMIDFRDKAPLSAADAATVILDGIRAGTWRILVGEDAKYLDRKVRESPDEAYEDGFASLAALRR